MSYGFTWEGDANLATLPRSHGLFLGNRAIKTQETAEAHLNNIFFMTIFVVSGHTAKVGVNGTNGWVALNSQFARTSENWSARALTCKRSFVV